MDYDLIIVGGGLAGSSLGAALAREGRHVLIVEREPGFRDRVRGEGMLPWGADEAQKLGIYNILVENCAHPVRWLSAPDSSRDLLETTPLRLGFLNFHHPEMQQCLLDVAVECGAEVLQPAEAIAVSSGHSPSIVIRTGGVERKVTARLLVGADGRNSRVRSSVGFQVERDHEYLNTAGTLYRNLSLPDDAVQMLINPDQQKLSILFPIGRGRVRAYLCYRHDALSDFNGERDQTRFVATSIAVGAKADWFENAEPIGPLASFSGADCWATHPYRGGVALVGDAAAASDPAFGCGLSLTLRDVRVLRDHLLEETDWLKAADTYAGEHNTYYSALHHIHDLWRDLFFDVGDAAEALRQRALPLIGQDSTRMIDFIGLGPEAPCDEAACRRFFGEQ